MEVVIGLDRVDDNEEVWNPSTQNNTQVKKREIIARVDGNSLALLWQDGHKHLERIRNLCRFKDVMFRLEGWRLEVEEVVEVASGVGDCVALVKVEGQKIFIFIAGGWLAGIARTTWWLGAVYCNSASCMHETSYARRVYDVDHGGTKVEAGWSRINGGICTFNIWPLFCQ